MKLSPGLEFQLRRAKGFLGMLARSRRAVVGIALLLFFTMLAVAAPLLTSNDPMRGYYVAGDFSKPSWLRYFPGGQSLSENALLSDDPGFDNQTAIGQWKFQTDNPAATLQYNGSFGFTAPGSAVLSYTRAAQPPQGTVNMTLSRSFQFDATLPPKRFAVQVAFLASGYENVDSLRIRFILGRDGGKQHIVWTFPFGATENRTWFAPRSIDSYNPEVRRIFDPSGIGDPAKIVFRSPGTYTLTLELSVQDTKPGPVDVQMVIDDFDMRIFGTSYGLLGTDHLGRDIFSQLAYGARISLTVGLAASGISVIIGLLIGLLAGYLGKFADELLMRFSDMILVLPGLPLLIVLAATLGSSINNVILALALLGWPGFARVVRSQVLSLKERPFIEAAKAAGAGTGHIIGRHIIPNVMSLTYVSLALAVPTAIVSEAALAFLGLFDPTIISWGKMLFDAQSQQAITQWWWILPPGFGIALLSLSFVLIGYALDEMFNPKLRQRR